MNFFKVLYSKHAIFFLANNHIILFKITFILETLPYFIAGFIACHVGRLYISNHIYLLGSFLYLSEIARKIIYPKCQS